MLIGRCGLGAARRGRFAFSVGSVLLHYIRTLMNRVRWEENRELRALETRGSTQPRSTEQANQLFVATEHSLALSEEARLRRIDTILGTRTHYTLPKPFQERLDSDHVMDLEELKRQSREPDRATLNWLNPKSEVRLRFKNKRKFYSFLSRLRTYPRHAARVLPLHDDQHPDTIAFLAAEALYSNISLKPVELTVQSLQEEPAGAAEKPYFESEKYVYFRPQGEMRLLRLPKGALPAEEGARTEAVAVAAGEGRGQEVASLEEVYAALREHDTDERVSEYLKKVQNGRLEYLFSFLSLDRTEDTLALTIDLLGTKKEYCLLLKSMAQPHARPLPIFNIRPHAAFSADARHICYVQRSPEATWTELVYRTVASCWAHPNQLTLAQEEEGEVVYQCEATEELRVGTDSSRSYIFLAVRECLKEFSERLYLLERREEGVELVELDRGQRCRYYFDVCPLGIIFSRFHPSSSLLKFGSNPHFATSVQLIPLKQHLQLTNEKIGLADAPLLTTTQPEVHPASQFDVGATRTIFHAKENEFMVELQTRASHLIAVMNLHSVYDRALLSFLPFKLAAHPHALLLGGGASLALRSHAHAYARQDVEFSRPHGCLALQKTYSIWKKELADADQERARFHHETLIINEDQPHPFELSVTTRSLYAQQRDLPVLLFFPSAGETLEGAPARQLLEKGVRIVEFRGRGTLSGDLERLLGGNRGNFGGLLDDLQAAVEFVGNNLTASISLYAKGATGSLAGLWFNAYFPYLFNASVLHNGHYDLTDHTNAPKVTELLGLDTHAADWERFDIFKQSFRHARLGEREGEQAWGLGTLEHVVVSSSSHEHRPQSRKLVRRLRENQELQYDEVYLKEHDNEYEADLFNLSYIYARIRTRLEQERNDPDSDANNDDDSQINETNDKDSPEGSNSSSPKPV